jgi:hypothetical protein
MMNLIHFDETSSPADRGFYAFHACNYLSPPSLWQTRGGETTEEKMRGNKYFHDNSPHMLSYSCKEASLVNA